MNGFKLASREGLNPFIAMDISWTTGLWDAQQESFESCWARIFEDDDPRLELCDGRLSGAQIAYFCAKLQDSTSLLEEFICEYLDTLPDECKASTYILDPTIITDCISELLFKYERIGEPSLEYYRHDDAIARRYSSSGFVAIRPFMSATNRAIPLPEIARQVLLAMSDKDCEGDYLPDFLKKIGVPPSPVNTRFLLFLAQNNPYLLSDLNEPLTFGSIDIVSKKFNLCIENQKFSNVVKFENDVTGSQFKAPKTVVTVNTEPVMKALDRQDLEEPLATELTLKAFAISKHKHKKYLGVPFYTYKFLKNILELKAQIVSLSDLRKLSGLNDLEIDPYALEHGPIVCYAPSERYLKGGAVSFALKDWVADETHKKSRISPDRILTPLNPVLLPTHQSIDLALEQAPLALRAKIIVPNEILRSIIPQVHRQADRWVAERCSRLICEYAHQRRYLKVGSIFFEREAWGLLGKKISLDIARKYISRRLNEGVLQHTLRIGPQLSAKLKQLAGIA